MINFFDSKQNSSRLFIFSEKMEEKKRKFREQWCIDFPWVEHRNGKAFCKICTEAVDKKLLLPTDGQANSAKEAFVINGFLSWSRAVSAFQNHENSDLHNAAAKGLLITKKNEMEIDKSFSQGSLCNRLVIGCVPELH